MNDFTNNYRYWARKQFAKYRGCVAFVTTADSDGNPNIGSCFHVGDGVFITARHVVENRALQIGFDDGSVNQQLLRDPKDWGRKTHGQVNIVTPPKFHHDALVDVACFRVEPFPEAYLPLGGHFDDYLSQYELVLYRTLVLGYPPIPLTAEPVLVASLGEVNAQTNLYVGSKHVHFLISTMARGGFSGAPVLVAYNEDSTETGTAILGLVTQSLTKDHELPQQGYMAVLGVEPIVACLNEHGMLPKCQGFA